MAISEKGQATALPAPDYVLLRFIHSLLYTEWPIPAQTRF